jgi:hypothetical protein
MARGGHPGQVAGFPPRRPAEAGTPGVPPARAVPGGQKSLGLVVPIRAARVAAGGTLRPSVVRRAARAQVRANRRETLRSWRSPRHGLSNRYPPASEDGPNQFGPASAGRASRTDLVPPDVLLAAHRRAPPASPAERTQPWWVTVILVAVMACFGVTIALLALVEWHATH